jgi:hypothetical protein
MPGVEETYAAALEALLGKVKADPCVLAAILLGSMAHDTVWQRSDIDLLLVTQEAKRKKEGLCLVEAGINIHCSLATRSEFRKMLEGAVQGSFIHSLLLKGKMLFSRDEPLSELFEARKALGERDRAIQLLRVASSVLPCIAKAEKWFHVRRDYAYCCFWILKCVDALASVEVLLHGEVPAREVVQQALPLNPPLFRTIYTELIEERATPDRLQTALAAIEDTLRANARALFGPILEYLEDEGSLRSITDINHHFERHFNIESVDIACEWLADEGMLHKLATPVRLTERSHVDVEEAAYFFPGDERN